MTRDPLAAVTTTVTPQTRPVPGRADQVKNNAGGYVFGKGDEAKVRDFLTLGTTGGAYYLNEDKLTGQNSELVLRFARERGADMAAIAHELSTAVPARVPKNRGCLFGLAAVSAMGDPDGIQRVKGLLPEVARTTDHLSTWFGYRKQLKGKPTGRGTGIVSSRAFKGTLVNWLLRADADSVAFGACKARQRKTPAGEAFALRDVMRIARPTPADFGPERGMLFAWLAGKASDEAAADVLPTVARFMRAQAVTSPAEAIRVITEDRVPWEFLPSRVLADKGVWEALAGTVGMTALIRNIARMTRIGAIAPFSETSRLVASRLTDPVALAKGRIHPMDVYLALRVYACGYSQPHSKADLDRWVPVADMLDALEESYELCFSHVQPSGKRYIIAVDSSGSMAASQPSFSGARLGSTYQVANSIALTMKRIEGDNVQVIDLDTSIHPSPVTRRTRLAELQARGPSGGGTDLSLPFEYARQNHLTVDGFGVLTDGETWAGRSHPFQSLAAYRQQFNPDARVVVAAMIPYGFSILEQSDPGVMNMAGLDASLPLAMTSFMRGNAG